MGRGRYGVVYRAWDPALDREVALKVLRCRERVDADDVRVIEEGRVMARVRHPNVVTIFGAQRINGQTGLWMEFVHGQTLESELQGRGAFDATSLAQVGRDLCAALDAVHSAGLVHRDVKAQNVLREGGGRVVLGDFGTGRELDDDGGAGPELAGTPVYLAPEIFAKQEASPRSDVYSLGVLLYHLATRDYPVKGRSLEHLRKAHQQLRQLASLRQVRPDLPDPLVRAIDRACAPDPARRFASALEFVDALTTLPSRRVARGSSRAIVAGASAAALVLVALTAVLMRTGLVSATVPLNARDWVLVTAVENRTGEAVLDGTLGHALQRELSQSTFVNVVPRPRVVDALQLMRKPADTVLDTATSREVALRDGGIRALITGRVERSGAAYGVSVDIVRPSDGVLLASVSEPPVEQNQLLGAIGRVAVAIRHRLGEQLPEGEANQPPLQRVTTSSLRALQLFSQASSVLDGQGGAFAHAAAAEQLLKAAIAKDPSFAAAHALLAEMIRIQGQRLQEVDEHIGHAVALSGNVTEIERLRIEGSLAFRSQLTNDPAEQTRWIQHGISRNEAILRLQPDNYESLVILTNLYAQLRRPNAPLATRLADMRPQSYEWVGRAVTAALWTGDVETARRYAQRGSRLEVPVPPQGPRAWAPAWMRLFPAIEAWLRDGSQRAAAAADRVASGFAFLPAAVRDAFALQLSYLYLMLGRSDAAEAFAARSENQELRRVAFLRIAIARGDARRISEVIDTQYGSLEEAAPVASALVLSGRLAGAGNAVEVLRKRSTAPPTLDDYVEGQIALEEGRLDAALRGVEVHLRTFRPGGGHYVAETMARVLAARGHVNRAIALLESYSTPRVQIVAQPGVLGHEWLAVRNRLAMLYRAVGRHREADDVDAELASLLAAGDDDHPIKRRVQESGRWKGAR